MIIRVNIRNVINRNGSFKMLLNTTTYNYDCEISITLYITDLGFP